jgi:hypothetical protein
MELEIDDLDEQHRPNKLIPRSFRQRLPVEQEIADAKKSLAFWWYRCLQLSDPYQQCCEDEGHGACADLYKDLGDVRLPFARWWVKHGRKAFAEQKPMKEVLRIESYKQADDQVEKADRLVLSIPLTLRKTTAVRQVSKLLAQVHAQRDPVDIWRASTAKRMIIRNKLRQRTIEQLLRLWQLRQQDPDMSLYELGKQAGIELDLLARDTQGEEITEAMERRRMTIAVSRQLLQARYLIANAAQGVFPSLKPPAEIALEKQQ